MFTSKQNSIFAVFLQYLNSIFAVFKQCFCSIIFYSAINEKSTWGILTYFVIKGTPKHLTNSVAPEFPELGKAVWCLVAKYIFTMQDLFLHTEERYKK